MACGLAHDYGARLIVVHIQPYFTVAFGEVGPILPDPGDLRQELQESLTALRPPDPGVSVEYRLCEGDPATEVVRLAGETHSDLIVMATHGRTGISRLLLGSVTEMVLRRAPCPVLTIRIPFPEAVPVVSPSAGEPVHA
jgi:nucleotide-binding universal stress UspA family protein